MIIVLSFLMSPICVYFFFIKNRIIIDKYGINPKYIKAQTLIIRLIEIFYEEYKRKIQPLFYFFYLYVSNNAYEIYIKAPLQNVYYAHMSKRYFF